jgi:hypothetical protein
VETNCFADDLIGGNSLNIPAQHRLRQPTFNTNTTDVLCRKHEDCIHKDDKHATHSRTAISDDSVSVLHSYIDDVKKSHTSQTTFNMQEFDANILKIFKALGFDVLILNYS